MGIRWGCKGMQMGYKTDTRGMGLKGHRGYNWMQETKRGYKVWGRHKEHVRVGNSKFWLHF